MKKMMIALLALLSALASAQTRTESASHAETPAKVQTWDANTIVWQKVDSDGTKWSVLEGDKDAPGKTFTYAFFIPGGYWEHHWHTQDARVAVIQGALKVALGDTLDKAGAVSYPVGSYLFVPANAQHTMGADVDTIIIGSAMGPWKTHHHEEHQPAEQHHHH